MKSEGRLLRQGGLRCASACQIQAPPSEIFFSLCRPLGPGYHTSRSGCLIPVRGLLILVSRCRILLPVGCQDRPDGYHPPRKRVIQHFPGHPCLDVQVLLKVSGQLPDLRVAAQLLCRGVQGMVLQVEQARQLFLVELFHPSGEAPGVDQFEGQSPTHIVRGKSANKPMGSVNQELGVGARRLDPKSAI